VVLGVEMRLLSLILGVVVAVGATVSADAATYNFTLDSTNYDVTGQITTSGNLITSISGNVTGLLNAPIGGLDGQYNIYYTSDNQITFASPYITNAGALFDAGGYFFNVYSVANGPTFDYYLSSTQFGADYFTNPLFNPGDMILNGSVTAVPSPTPLPSTWIMMIAGFLVFSIVGFRRREPVALAATVRA
jgi:hypothetical protein